MTSLRAWVLLLATVVAGQAAFDACLLRCHGAVEVHAASCHAAQADNAPTRMIEASSCGHDHFRVGLDDSETPTTSSATSPATLVSAADMPLYLEPSRHEAPIPIAAGVAGRSALDTPLRI